MNARYDSESLRRLSVEERRGLMRRLVAIEGESSARPGRGWKWDALLVFLVACCVVLAAWIGWLAITLPKLERVRSWRGAWVGFDIGLLAAFAFTCWAAWRRRQLLIMTLYVLATLLACDAWFDIMLDVKTTGIWLSVASAVLVELPLAALALLMARRLLRLTVEQVMRYEGDARPVPPLWKIPLLGPDTATPLRRLMQARARYLETGVASAEPLAESGSAAGSSPDSSDTSG